MKNAMISRDWIAAICLAVFSLLHAGPLRAETVLVDTSTLVDTAKTVVFPFVASGPGTFEIVLKDLEWTERFASLSIALTDARQVLSRRDGAGVFSVEFQGAGLLYAHVSGMTGQLRFALFGLIVKFHPATPTVPLPAAAWLLLGGLGALGGSAAFARRNRVERLLPPEQTA